MKKWIAGTILAAGLVVFGGAAVAQDAAPGNGGQRSDGQQEEARPGDHEGCRFGGEGLDKDEV